VELPAVRRPALEPPPAADELAPGAAVRQA
jgi:hypothetical protein